MELRRMVVDIPADIYERFKEECKKNRTHVKDGIERLLCEHLDGALIEDLDEEGAKSTPPFIKAELDEKIKAELAPIREKLDGLEPSDVSAIREDVDGLKAALAAPQVCPRLEDLDKKFSVLANFIENHIYLFMKLQGANPCAEDIQGLSILRNEELPSTKGLDRDQLKELFKKRMKTKAF